MGRHSRPEGGYTLGRVVDEFPYYDRTLRCIVRNERERQAAMKLRNLMDARDWDDIESVEKTAQRNLRERLAKRDGYMTDPVGRALYKIAHGYPEDSTMRELEAALLRGREESERDATQPAF
jgi:hypothetical protein